MRLWSHGLMVYTTISNWRVFARDVGFREYTHPANFHGRQQQTRGGCQVKQGWPAASADYRRSNENLGDKQTIEFNRHVSSGVGKHLVVSRLFARPRRPHLFANLRLSGTTLVALCETSCHQLNVGGKIPVRGFSNVCLHAACWSHRLANRHVRIATIRRDHIQHL